MEKKSYPILQMQKQWKGLNTICVCFHVSILQQTNNNCIVNKKS